jgi:hypothetical protein
MSGQPAKLHVARRSAQTVIIHISSGAEMNVNLLLFCSLFVMYGAKHIEFNV